MLLPLLLVACAPPVADRYLAWQRAGDGYSVAPREAGDLDLAAVSGALGTIQQGGRVTFEDDGSTTWGGGRALHVGYDVAAALAIPMDEGGLTLWSFYGHLSDLAAELPDHGLDPAVFFPVDAAWTPVLPDVLLELLPQENAAYATGGHFFILLDDLADHEPPLAANAGIVRHEFGHAAFHALTCGDPLAPPPFDADDEGAEALYHASLHEGFADAFAALTLDDPAFFAPSVDLPGRALDGDQVVADVELPEAFLESSKDDLLAIWDPYPLGSVLAAVAWDLRLALDDPARALAVLIAGTRAWTALGALGDAWGFLEAWAASAAEGAEREALCAALVTRFGDLAPAGCAP